MKLGTKLTKSAQSSLPVEVAVVPLPVWVNPLLPKESVITSPEVVT